MKEEAQSIHTQLIGEKATAESTPRSVSDPKPKA